MKKKSRGATITYNEEVYSVYFRYYDFVDYRNASNKRPSA